jgi:hypothetical protein
MSTNTLEFIANLTKNIQFAENLHIQLHKIVWFGKID